jgi:CBS domain-containing protein
MSEFQHRKLNFGPIMKKPVHRTRKLGMKIKDIMTRNLATIPAQASVQAAAEKMSERDVGMLPVCQGERVIGLLTDRDITVRAIAEGRNPARTRVTDIMTTEYFYCFDHEDVREAVETFEKVQIRRLPIFNRRKKLVGVLSIGDLAVDTGNKLLAGEVLKKVSEPERLRC